MRLQIDSNPAKFDIQAALTDLTKVRQMRSQDNGGAITFTGADSVLSSGALHGLGENGLPADQERATREELRRLLRSPLLVQSNRLSRFLSFAVEMTLKGNGHALKEYTIAIEVYGRRQDFDPSQDSIVRGEARRLRTKLAEYYDEEGKDDPIFICFRPGSYVPAFRVNKTIKPRSFEDQKDGRSTRLQGISISVVPFTHSSGDTFGEACARGLTDEFVHRLTKIEGLRVFASSAEQTGVAAETRLKRKGRTWITSEGSVRTEGNRVRVTSRLCDEDGLHVASWRFDAEINREALFGTLEKMASRIVTCIQKHNSGEANP